MRKLAQRMDNWINTVTGLGYALRDKVRGWELEAMDTLADTTLERLFRADPMARKVCAKLPEAALRPGFDVLVEDDKDLGQRVLARADDLDAASKLQTGFTWGRVFGGAVAVIGADDGRPPDQPLDLGNIKSIDWIDVLDRREIEPDNPRLHSRRVEAAEHFKYVDPLDRRAAFGFRVHRSRMLFFPGAETTREQKNRNNGWDDSVLQSVYDALRSFQNNVKSATHLVSDASQGVFKISGLQRIMSAGGKAAIKDRIAMLDEARSVARALILDADNGEEFERRSTSFAGLADMIDRTMLYVASAADMPVTVLFGRQPAGLNATGDNDTRAWYDAVDGWRKNTARRPLEYLVRVLIAAEGQDPEAVDWSIKFRPLWQMTIKEELEARKTQSEVDKAYLDAGVLDTDQVAESRFTSEGFSFETQPVEQDEGREAMKRAEKALAEGDEDVKQGETVPDSGGEGDATAKDPGAAYAGVQVTALQKILETVATGKIPKESAIKLITAAYPMSEETARAMVDPIEEKESEPDPVPPAPPGQEGDDDDPGDGGEGGPPPGEEADQGEEPSAEGPEGDPDPTG